MCFRIREGIPYLTLESAWYVLKPLLSYCSGFVIINVSNMDATIIPLKKFTRFLKGDADFFFIKECTETELPLCS